MKYRAGLAVVLVALCLFDLYAAMKHGYLSVFPPFQDLPKTQMFVDLAISLGLFILWMFSDGKQRGRRVIQIVPFAVATVLFGAVGPLLYLIFRGESRPNAL